MPVYTAHLLSLTVPLPEFLSLLSNSDLEPLTVARVVRWVVRPTNASVDVLLGDNAKWDVLVITPDTNPLPKVLQQVVRGQWSVRAGIPARVIKEFAERNQRLLHPLPEDVPQLTGALDKPLIAHSSQSLELSNELQDWVRVFAQREGKTAVSMLNLLAFKDGMKDEYLKYGKAFAESIGSRRGGFAKIVGRVINEKVSTSSQEWDEIALAHYPSIWHFADMLASKDYQEVNQKHRIPALQDTFILCTTELGLPWPNSHANL
jgi:hypothetical protein